MTRHARRRIRRVDAGRGVARVVLAALLVLAGLSHLSWGRRGYRIVVPDWSTRMLRTNADTIVVVSGVAEVGLGAALLVPGRVRRPVGLAIAAFFVAVLPGNVHQWRTGRSAPLLRTDRARFGRLFLQPLLVAWALWATGGHPADARR